MEQVPMAGATPEPITMAGVQAMIQTMMTEQREEMRQILLIYGGLRSELSNRPIEEMSLSVTRVVLFSFPVRSRRNIETSELGGKPCGVALVAIFHNSI